MARLPEEDMPYTASHKYARISPRKVRALADLVRGKFADEALDILRFQPHRGARMLEKVIKSALGNAEHQQAAGIDVSVASGTLVPRNLATWNPEVILTPGRGVNMGDGWETARRRVPGNEWIVIQLGIPGRITRVEVDTAHFKGNFPAACSLQAAAMPALGQAALVTQSMFWPEVLAPSPLSADAIHPLACQTDEVVTRVKLNTYPDGGISRLRIFGVSA